MERLDEGRHLVLGEIRQRAVGAHAARVRPLVVVSKSLVVACERKREGIAAVREDDEARLAAAQPLLDDHAGTRRREGRREGIVRVVQPVADGHALAGGQPVGLDDDSVPGLRQLAGECQRRRELGERRGSRHADAGGRGHLVAEGLAALDPGRGPRGPEDGDARRR